MIKWIPVLICLFICKASIAQQPQPNCTLLTTYGNDGRAIRSTVPQTIDSVAEGKCTIALQATSGSNYITVSFVSKTEAKKMDGDLVVKFADNSSINVPLGTCTTITSQNITGFTCNYIIIDKYVSALKTKTVSNVIFRMVDNSFKAIDMKKYEGVLKNAIICLAPAVY